MFNANVYDANVFFFSKMPTFLQRFLDGNSVFINVPVKQLIMLPMGIKT